MGKIKDKETIMHSLFIIASLQQLKLKNLQYCHRQRHCYHTQSVSRLMSETLIEKGVANK